jgi:hypothetical protein
MKLFAIAFVGTTVTLLAQAPGTHGGTSTGAFSIPTLGFVVRQTPVQLQPILGIPGSARLGSPLPLPNTVTQIHLAPGHAYALVEQGRSNPLSLVLLQGVAAQAAALTLTPVNGATNEIDLLAFSPIGRSAVIYSRQTNQLQILTGLPKSPRLFLSVPNVATPEAPQKLAVSDDAQTVLIADGGGSVYSLSQNATPVLVYRSPDISAIDFVAQTGDAMICDRSVNRPLVLQHSSTAPVALMATSNDDCQPEAAASTTDGKTILLACPAQHAVLSVDRVSGSTRVHNVSSGPGVLARLSVRDTFLMSPPDGGTYWMFTWQPNGPVMSFVAAAPNVTQGLGH